MCTENSFYVLLFTFFKNCARIIRRSVEGYDLYSRIAPDYASVAQWIEQCPPEACAAVRLRPDVYFLCPGTDKERAKYRYVLEKIM